MKAQIKNIGKESIKMKDNTIKDKYIITFFDDEKEYESWSIGESKIGDTIEGETTERFYNGKTYYGIKIKLPQKSGGGYRAAAQPSRDESFACAYAKDIVVALLRTNMVQHIEQADNMLDKYFTIFMTKLKGA
jgi:hypothetical protein